MNADFSGLPLGTHLSDQLPGIVFRRYQDRVGGVVIDSPSGRVASFNDCPGCEFFATGAEVSFSTLQRRVTLHAGLLAVPGAVVQRRLRLAAFGSNGLLLAATTSPVEVTAGDGFRVALTIDFPTSHIASVVLEAVDDPEQLALIALLSVDFEETSGRGIPDFVLDGPAGVTVLQGGPPVQVALAITRIGGSTGAIDFSLSPLPAGVTASFLPNPAPADLVSLRLEASADPPPGLTTVLVTGTPMDQAAGPAPRTLEIDVVTAPMLRLVGPADIDFAGCSSSGTHGTVVREYFVIRDPGVSGPIDVSLEGLPADVTATLDPQRLDFPGGAINQRLTVSLTTIAGLVVPPTFITLRLAGPGLDVPFALPVFGSCPQQNRNFVIRGQFLYLNQGDGQHPIEGVQVEVFRWNGDWITDDRVGGTFTDDQGSFSCELHAARDGDYYARLRLHSEDAQVMEAYKSSVWSWDSPRASNRGGLIDIGTWEFSRYQGNGSPHAAIWQGFRNAAIEFQQTTGGPVPGGQVNVENWLGHITPLAFYDEVHWADGYDTGRPIFFDQSTVRCYGVTSHEFAHVIRDVLDGNEPHWHADNAVYVYGRKHDRCTGPTPDSERKAGFAFHEGWARYWSGETRCCPYAIDNDEIEGTVAHSLFRLSKHTGVGRAGMARVLARGQNLIHADYEFRREFALEFPELPPGTISDGCRGAVRGVRERIDPQLDRALQRERLGLDIEAIENQMGVLREEQRGRAGLRSIAVKATVEEGALVVQRMRDGLVALDRDDPPEVYAQRAYLTRRQSADFVARRRAIQISAMREALSQSSPEQRTGIERRLWLVQESRIEDASLVSLLPLPSTVADDAKRLPAPVRLVRRHVVPSRRGGWDVKKPGAARSSGHFRTQRQAQERARQIVDRLGGGEVTTHGTDGRIRDSDTVAPGRDPNPPKDT